MLFNGKTLADWKNENSPDNEIDCVGTLDGEIIGVSIGQNVFLYNGKTLYFDSSENAKLFMEALVNG